MSNRIKVFSPNAANQVKIVKGEQTVVKVTSTGPQGPPGPSSIFEGGNITGPTTHSGSFTISGSFLDLSQATAVTGSHYSASKAHTGSFGRLEVAGNSSFGGNVTIGGNISIGDANTDSLTISSELSSSLIPDIDGTFDIGSTSKNWKFGYIEQVTSTHVTASGNISSSAAIISNQVTASDAKVTGTLTVHDDVVVGEYISHKGDANTRFNFTDDRVQLEVGGINFFGAHKKDSTPHLFTINNGGNHIDFQIKDNDGDTLFRTDADSDNVLFPDAVQISGSATSTGSFGRVETSVIGGLSPLRVESDNFKVDANGSITFSGNISGSSTSTGSFDNLRVSGLSVPDMKVMSSSLSSRLSVEEANVDALQSDSGSFSTRVTGLKADSGSFSSRITNDSSSISTRLTTEESNVDTLQSRVGQSLNVSDAPTFGGLTIQGTLTAQTYVVSSSITTMSIAQSSGSTVFGNSDDDTHTFVGNTISGSSTSTGSFGSLVIGDVSVPNFKTLSGSISTRLTTEETNVNALQSDSGSFSTRITNATSSIAGLKVDSGSFSTRLTTEEANVDVLQAASASFSTRVTTEEANVDVLQTASGSFSTRVTTEEANVDVLQAASASFSTRVTTEEANVDALQSDSGSFSTRLTTEEANIDALQVDSGSFDTRIANATSSIAGLKADSGSFDTRITNATSSILGLKTDSGSISTRITNIETNAGGQSLNTTDSPTFAGLTTTGNVVIQGTLTAETYVVSSSVTTMSVQQASGSTIFGDSIDDTHQFTGSLSLSGSFSANSTSTSSFGMVTASYFYGDGSNLTGITSVTTQSIQNLNAGIISGSSQLPSGLVSGSSQIVSISDSAPSNPVEGDLWWKSNDGNMYVYYDGYWVISVDTTTIIPSGTISGSAQLSHGFGNVSGSVSSTGSFGAIEVGGGHFTSASLAAGGTSDFNIFDLEDAVVDENTTSILNITFVTDANGELIKASNS